jgi:outer membrane receptor protein involved in Fe transport
LRTAVYRGWRLPTLNELYRPFRAGADATAANAALRNETSVGVEAGADVRLAAGFTGSVTLFANRLDHAIANVTLFQGPGNCPGAGSVSAFGSCRQRQNLDLIRSRGAEFDVSGKLGDFDTRLSYSYTDARVHAPGIAASLDGLRPAQTPRHNASATLGWRGPGQVFASVTGRYVSDQFEDDQNSRVLHGAVTFDAMGEIPLTRRLAVEARAENLFNRRIEAAVSADGVVERALPRTLWIGLRLR